MNEVTRAALRRTGLPLDQDGRPDMTYDVSFEGSRPTLELDFDGDLEVQYGEDFSGGYVNGSWGSVGVGGAWISTGGRDWSGRPADVGDLLDYEGHENGDLVGPDSVLRKFTGSIMLAALEVLDPGMFEILSLLGELPDPPSLDAAEEWIDEHEESALTLSHLEAAAGDIWYMICGMRGAPGMRVGDFLEPSQVVLAIHEDVRRSGIRPVPSPIPDVRSGRYRGDVLYVRTGYRHDPDWDASDREGRGEWSLLSLARRYFGREYADSGVRVVDDGTSGGWTWVIIEPHGSDPRGGDDLDGDR